MPSTADIAIAGGGAAGLALALAIITATPERRVTVADGRRSPDPRTWCFFDEGSNPVPEAVSTTWSRWEIRTSTGSCTATDPDHPYTMVKAVDYRTSMTRRLMALPGVTLIEGIPVTGIETNDDGGFTARTPSGDVTAPVLIDARGPRMTGSVPKGRVVLHQRFLGQWIHATRPVFDDSTVTLMDFTAGEDAGGPHFMYVLPLSETDALIESTVFSRTDAGGEPFRERIAAYVGHRWGLRAEEWTITGQEAGNIPMTDAAVAPSPIPAAGVRAGATRPSTGYAFTRIQQHARVTADAIRNGDPMPAIVDRRRTRLLDAIFLRFLRDQPAQAADVFLRLFGRLPGPVTVRFLTERSTILDVVRVIGVLPKLPFLAAALTTARERLR